MTKRAVCVGVDRYADATIPALGGAARDARAMAAALTSRLGFLEADVKVLVDAQATRDGVLRAVDWLLMMAAPGDVLVLYVASHGTVMPDRSTPSELDEVLVVHDHDFSFNQLRDDDLALKLQRVPAGAQAVCILDAGRRAPLPPPAGPARYGAPLEAQGRFLLPPADHPALAPLRSGTWRLASRLHARRGDDPPYVTLAACGEDEVAHESASGGAFTQALLHALGGGSGLPWNELARLAGERLRQQGLAQHPVCVAPIGSAPGAAAAPPTAWSPGGQAPTSPWSPPGAPGAPGFGASGGAPGSGAPGAPGFGAPGFGAPGGAPGPGAPGGAPPAWSSPGGAPGAWSPPGSPASPGGPGAGAIAGGLAAAGALAAGALGALGFGGGQPAQPAPGGWTPGAPAGGPPSGPGGVGGPPFGGAPGGGPPFGGAPTGAPYGGQGGAPYGGQPSGFGGQPTAMATVGASPAVAPFGAPAAGGAMTGWSGASMAGGANPIDQELARFSDADVSVRVCQKLLGALPFAPRLASYRNLQEVIDVLYPQADAAVQQRARALASSPETAAALRGLTLVDTASTGLAAFSALKGAFGLLRGQGAAALETDPQQGLDAAVKLLAIAHAVYRLFPGPVAGRVQYFHMTPAGQHLSIYFGAIDVALPFADNLASGAGSVLGGLWQRYGGAASGKLGAAVGAAGASEAQGVLGSLIAPLDGVVQRVAPYAQQAAGAAAQQLPGVMNVADKVAGLAATTLDALPIYRYLGARLAAEAVVLVASRGA